jgi:tetratricopeptide (TPR) repeat protein
LVVRKSRRRWRLYLASGLVTAVAAGALFTVGSARGGATAAPALLPPPPGPETAAVHVERADDLLLAGDWAGAVAAYNEANRLEPDLVDAHVGAALAMVFSHRYDEAIERAEQAAALAPRSPDARTVLALAHNWNGNSSRALAEAQRAVRADGSVAVAHAYVAEAQTDRYKLPEADAAIHRALELAPNDPEVLRVYGYLLETRQDYAAAIDVYERAIAARPRWGHLHLALGHAQRVLRRYEDAALAFGRAAEVSPSDPRAEGALGMMAFDQEDYATAVGHFERAIEIDPSYPTGHGQLGVIYYQRRDYPRAQPLFERAIELERSPARNASYRHALGWIYLANKQESLAREQFTKALELSPGLHGARDGLARLGAR